MGFDERVDTIGADVARVTVAERRSPSFKVLTGEGRLGAITSAAVVAFRLVTFVLGRFVLFVEGKGTTGGVRAYTGALTAGRMDGPPGLVIVAVACDVVRCSWLDVDDVVSSRTGTVEVGRCSLSLESV